MSDVQVVKLTTGEDVMGRVTEVELADHGKVLKIDRPTAIILRPKDEAGTQFGVGLAPYAIYAENHSIMIMPAHVVAIFPPDGKLKDEYISKVTGIALDTGTQVLKEGIN